MKTISKLAAQEDLISAEELIEVIEHAVSNDLAIGFDLDHIHKRNNKFTSSQQETIKTILSRGLYSAVARERLDQQSYYIAAISTFEYHRK